MRYVTNHKHPLQLIHRAPQRYSFPCKISPPCHGKAQHSNRTCWYDTCNLCLMWTLALCLSDGMSSSRMADVEEQDRDTFAASYSREVIRWIARVFKSNRRPKPCLTVKFNASFLWLLSQTPQKISNKSWMCVLTWLDFEGILPNVWHPKIQINRAKLRDWWLNKTGIQLL